MKIELWTDGSGLGVDPITAGAPGAWAYTLVALDADGTVLRQRDAAGAALRTSSNRMELTAVLEGLRAVREGAKLTVYSDSQYAIRPFRDGWIDNWKRCGWEIKNADIWEALDREAGHRVVTFKWIPGHAGLKFNELANDNAQAARRALLNALEADREPDSCGFPVVDGAPPPPPQQSLVLEATA